MTDSQPDLPQLPLTLSLRALVGLRSPAEGDWAPLRALQYAQLYRYARSRAIAHAIAVVITVSLYLGKAPLAGIVAWLVAIGAAQWFSWKIDFGLADIDCRSMTMREFKRQSFGVAGVAATWALVGRGRCEPRQFPMR